MMTSTPWYLPYDRELNVYLSGPMSGLPDDNKPEFTRVAELIRKNYDQFAVCSPADTSDWIARGGSRIHADFLRFDFARLLEADRIVVLPGWRSSKGAVAELLMATYIDLIVWAWDRTLDRIGPRVWPGEIYDAFVDQQWVPPRDRIEVVV